MSPVDDDEDSFYEDDIDGTARWHEFRNFVLSVVSRTLKEQDRHNSHEDTLHAEADPNTLVTTNGQRILVRATLETPQTVQRLRNAIEVLGGSRPANTEQRLVDYASRILLAFPGVLARSRMSLLRGDSVEIWDGNRLTAAALDLGIAAPPYVVADEHERGVVYSSDLGRHYEGWLSFDDSPSLPDRLTFLGRGRKHWRAYEEFCEELLAYLFVPPLSQVITQRSDEHGVNRRDFILPNYANFGFWRFMRNHYDADFVIAEAKNLNTGPGKNEVLQVANYLSPRGTGLFGFILAREAMNDTALWVCREQWAMNGKMIIGLDDGDVLQMIETKAAGGEPADMIRQKIEDFRLRI